METGWLVTLSTRQSLVGVLVFNAAFTAWLYLRPLDGAVFWLATSVAQGLGPLLALLLCLCGIRRTAPHGARGRGDTSGRRPALGKAPVLLAGGIACFAVGQAIPAVCVVAGYLFPSSHASGASHAVPALLATWANLCTVAAYPLLALGVLALPARLLAGATRARVLLDGLLLVVGLLAWSWYTVTGPLVLGTRASLLDRVTDLATPLGDVLLIACLLLVVSRATDVAGRPALRVLTLGLAALVATDSVYAYQAGHNLAPSGEMLDAVGWTTALMLIGLATSLVRAPASSPALDQPEGAMRGHTRATLPLWRALLPYTLAPAVGALVAYVWTHPGSGPNALALQVGVYLAAAALVGLLLLRQLASMVETRRLYAQLAARNTSLAAANARLDALATTDPLTGAPNHRAMVAALDRELARADSHADGCAVLFFDLDHFKALNDTYGHHAGDAALREVAALAQSTLRATDTVGRWGGEEFIALLPDTTAAAALVAAEHLRAAVSAHVFGAGGGLHLTCSVGVAAYPEHAAGRDALVDAADQAMYAAKALGRDQARVASDPAVGGLLNKATGGASREDATRLGTVAALRALLAMHDPAADRQAEAVGALGHALAMALGLGTAEAEAVRLAGYLRDVGTIGLPRADQDRTERLSDADREALRAHPVVGATVVGEVPVLRALAPLVRGHHERWDGAGYPDGLAGEAIPLGARILTVSDYYAAMAHDLPTEWPPEPDAGAALEEVRRGAGTQFDPVVVQALAGLLTEQAQALLTGAA